MTINAYGQNSLPVNVSKFESFGTSGKFQYGTTTFTVHSTLPMVRFTDPVNGSGVIYYNTGNQVLAMSTTSTPGTDFGFGVQYPHAAPIPQSQWPGLVLIGVGIGLIVAGLIVAASPLEVVALTATTLALGVLGFATALFGVMDLLLINGTAPPATIPITPGPLNFQTAQPQQVPYSPPDGLGTDGYDQATGGYPDGGGGDGSDGILIA